LSFRNGRFGGGRVTALSVSIRFAVILVAAGLLATIAAALFARFFAALVAAVPNGVGNNL
jgi:hypothetical protein